jgi:predicted RNA-binding protein with EMAP domain
MDLDALRYGNFSQLGEAITDWEQMVKKLAGLKKDAEDNLKAKADKADWKGANASVSRQFIAKTVAEFTDAHTQADSIARILRDTRGELVSCRAQLNDVISRASKQHLSVSDTGQGSFTVTANTTSQRTPAATPAPRTRRW